MNKFQENYIQLISLMTRRNFLKLSALSYVTLAIAGCIPKRVTTYAQPKEKLFVLSESEYTIMQAIADRMIPSGGKDDPGAIDLDVAGYVDKTLPSFPEDLQKLIKLLLRGFEYSPYIFSLKFKPFTYLNNEEKDEFLLDWATSRITVRNMGFLLLKTLSMTGYYAQEGSWEQIGYDGPWV